MAPVSSSTTSTGSLWLDAIFISFYISCMHLLKQIPKRDVHFRLGWHFRCQGHPTTLTVILSEAKNLKCSREMNLPAGKILRFFTPFRMTVSSQSDSFGISVKVHPGIGLGKLVLS